MELTHILLVTLKYIISFLYLELNRLPCVFKKYHTALLSSVSLSTVCIWELQLRELRLIQGMMEKFMGHFDEYEKCEQYRF